MRAIFFLLTLSIGSIVLSAIVSAIFVTNIVNVQPFDIGILCAGSTMFVTLIGVIKLCLSGL